MHTSIIFLLLAKQYFMKSSRNIRMFVAPAIAADGDLAMFALCGDIGNVVYWRFPSQATSINSLIASKLR